MINSKGDLKDYLESDKQALGINRRRPKFLGDEIWRFQRALRKHEYYSNVKCFGGKFLCAYWHMIHKMLGLLLGFTIPINTIEKGLKICHYGYIVIGDNVKIGKYVTIHSGVNIGQNYTIEDSPKIGDKCFISPGVKIFGKIEIGNNVIIGANSVVNKTFGCNLIIAGIPAAIIRNI